MELKGTDCMRDYDWIIVLEEKAGEEVTQTYVLFPAWSAGSMNPQDNDKDALVDGKEHGVDIQKSVSADIHFSSKFEECSNNNRNGVNASSSSVPTAGYNFINNNNKFSAAGPSNTAVNPTYENSSFQDASTSSHDPDMPALEDFTYFDDKAAVGAEADINNLESSSLIVMENPNHPNDPNVPEGDQALAAPDGFAPQWIGEHDPNNNNGRIEWDVPLGGEVDEPMVDPEVNEEVMDDDDFQDDVEWLMAPVKPPRATMTVSSTYEVGGPSTAAIKGPSFPLPTPRLHMEEMSDAEVANIISIGETHHRVATMREQVQVMESHAGQVVSRLKEIETRVQ
nr:hypothetical protein [Tanacetum cinerariifolium]